MTTFGTSSKGGENAPKNPHIGRAKTVFCAVSSHKRPGASKKLFFEQSFSPIVWPSLENQESGDDKGNSQHQSGTMQP
jgi:hypothetical protein